MFNRRENAIYRARREYLKILFHARESVTKSGRLYFNDETGNHVWMDSNGYCVRMKSGILLTANKIA